MPEGIRRQSYDEKRWSVGKARRAIQYELSNNSDEPLCGCNSFEDLQFYNYSYITV